MALMNVAAAHRILVRGAAADGNFAAAGRLTPPAPQGSLRLAKRHLDRAMPILEESLPKGHPFVATCANNMGLVRKGLGALLRASAALPPWVHPVPLMATRSLARGRRLE